MKTKTLIAYLQDLDPSGELECCAGNLDIFFVSKEPSYYDGRFQKLIRDETRAGYNIVGGEFVSDGDKIQLHAYSIVDAIWDNPNLPVEYNGAERLYKEKIEEARKEAIED